MRRIPTFTGSSSTITKSGLFSVVARNYHSQNSFYLSDTFKDVVAHKLDPIAKEFYEHRALKHPLFTSLEEFSKEGFTPSQFLIYRDNFFRRTQLTIPSIAATIRAAVIYGDFDAAALAFRNLSDEMGGGDINKMHSQLLLESHNIHGMNVFNLNPIARITDVENSKVLLPEVEEYRKAKEEIFTRNYPYIAGNTWAHELAADSMLDKFRKAFFEPYRSFYTPKEYENVMKFFAAHKDDSKEGGNVEQQHEEMARKTVESACLESLEHIDQVREGGLIFLNHQARLWDGMLREIERARHVGEIIKPKPRESRVVIEEIDESVERMQKLDEGRPNNIVKQASIKNSGLGKTR